MATSDVAKRSSGASWIASDGDAGARRLSTAMFGLRELLKM
jgi:hypothetical protein